MSFEVRAKRIDGRGCFTPAVDICGICEQPGYEIGWNHPKGVGAHKNCYTEIRDSEIEMVRHIMKIFSDQLKRSHAHSFAIAEVKNSIDPNETIKSFKEKNGDARLKELFDTVGKARVDKFASEI